MKEVLKQALEALELLTDTEQTFGALDYGDNAITAIREALAQPAQEPWCMKMNDCKTKCEDCPVEVAQPEQDVTMQSLKDLKRSVCDEVGKAALAQPAQEPVGYVGLTNSPFGEKLYPVLTLSVPVGSKLYTTPAQRPWVDLTSKDLNEIFEFAMTGEGAVHRAIAKFKEKNNG
jgi:hypothetical protein